MLGVRTRVEVRTSQLAPRELFSVEPLSMLGSLRELGRCSFSDEIEAAPATDVETALLLVQPDVDRCDFHQGPWAEAMDVSIELWADLDGVDWTTEALKIAIARRCPDPWLATCVASFIWEPLVRDPYAGNPFDGNHRYCVLRSLGVERALMLSEPW